MPMPFRVFISYSHDDSALLRELEQHLDILKQNQIISTWTDSDIMPGSNWEKQINAELLHAQIILLLVSANFLASPFCQSTEIKTVIARHNANTARVIPVLLRPCLWELAPFAKLQMTPLASDNRPLPVTSWSQRDDAYRAIVRGIHRLAMDLEPQGQAGSYVESVESGQALYQVKPSHIRVLSAPSREGNKAIILFVLDKTEYTLEYTRYDNLFSNQIIFLKHKQQELVRLPVPFATLKPIEKHANFRIDGVDGLLTFKMAAVTGIMNVKVEIEGVEVFHN